MARKSKAQAAKAEKPAASTRPKGPSAAAALERDRCATVDMLFTHHDHIAHVEDPIWADVSSLAAAGRTLFVTCDETASVEGLDWDPETGQADDHRSYPLGLVFELPEGAKGEMDIEGLAVSDGWLWVCGSHGLKRGKPGGKKFKDLRAIDWDPNRGFLGRLPLVERSGGRFEPVAAADPIDGAPERRAAMLPMTGTRDTYLRRMLAKDPLIAPFIDVPCKENGFDIEGIAAKGDEVILGLRGPVLRGWALIVRMRMKETKAGELKPEKREDGRRYAIHALDLNGQGIRDLAWDGDRLLILSGAISDHEALQSVFALDPKDFDREVIPGERLPRILDLVIQRGGDNAEGLEIVGEGEGRRLMIVYDSPHNHRTDADEGRLTGDLFMLD